MFRHLLLVVCTLLGHHATAPLPPPLLVFLAPATQDAEQFTSTVRFTVQIANIPYPFLHLLELSIFDHAAPVATPLGTISKFISPGTDLHSSARTRKKRKATAAAALKMYPSLAQYANQRMEFDTTDGDLWVSEPESLDFVARGLPNGRYTATCTLKRRTMQSDTGILLPPLIPASVAIEFQVNQYLVHIAITHLNAVPVHQHPRDAPIAHTYFSTIPSLLLNFTALLEQEHRQLPYRIPQDGSLSVNVDGVPHRGPMVSYEDGCSLLVGMLDDGPHVIALSPVDSLEGEPIPESAHVVASLHVVVKVPSRSGGVDIVTPHGIVEDGAVVELKIHIHPDENNNAFVIGQDGYVRVQLNNNTEHRIFSHGGPYDIQNVAEGIHHLEVLLLDLHLIPIIRTGGIAAVATTQFAFKPDDEEMTRRRQILALEKQSIEAMLTGGSSMVDHNRPRDVEEDDGDVPALPFPSVPPPMPNAVLVDRNAKRRQYALSAIGLALRSKAITRTEWSSVKRMIQEDRDGEPNLNFRDVLADVEQYDAGTAIEFAQNLVLEVEA